jgi:hypothetical protein
MLTKNIKYSIILNLKNIPGSKVRGKYVIFECDDWGGIRMPSAKVYKKMLNAGIPIHNNRFNKYDILANKQDLEQLFEVLLSVKDKNGHPAVMTPVVNVANPDFIKIKASGFTEYYYEPFTETLRKYYAGEDIFKMWKEGIAQGIFTPESHGREHISVQHWLQKLREGDKMLIYAFDHEFVSVPVNGVHKAILEFRPEFYFNHPSQIAFFKNSIPDGINLFKKLFGYIPNAFVPSNSIFHPLLEKVIAESGIKNLYVKHFNPVPDKNGNLKMKYYRIGKLTSFGLKYYTRNCVFEPTDPAYRGICHTLRQIETAFRWGKPAIISTHRVNFVGGIEEKNRLKGLFELKLLLKEIINKWTDVEFKSSENMFSQI